MSEDGVSSAGLSDEGNASLVGFGEGASSVVSGPTSTTGRVNSMGGNRGSGFQAQAAGSPMMGVQMGEETRGRNANMTGQETAERIVRERLGNGAGRPLGNPEDAQVLGRFGFEER